MEGEFQLLGQQDPKSETQAKFCFRCIPEKEIKNPPFALRLNANKFYCAQVPGLDFNDCGIFDGINDKNENIRLLFIDILSYMREYRVGLETIQKEVLPKTSDEFPALNRVYLLELNELMKILDTYLLDLENILKNPNQDGFLSAFVKAFTQFGDLKISMDKCHKILVDVQDEAQQASIKYSQEFCERLNGKTIYQVMNSRSSCQSKIADLAKTLAKTMPKEGNNKDIMFLLAFSANMAWYKDIECA